jgi:hypothetical protein
MTMSSLADICSAVQTIVLTVTGIRAAPDVPTETPNLMDAVSYCYPGTGTVTTKTPGRQDGEHTLHLTIITPRRNLRTDWARIIGFGDTVPRALLNDNSLGGTVMDINEIRYTFGAMEWAGQSELGWLFEIDVQETGSLS